MDREPAEHISADGDMTDWIAWRFYGRTEDVVEIVLEANRGLAQYGPVLPAGVRITLPVIPPPATTRVQRIWE